LLVDDAPVTTQGFAGSEQSGDFSQTEGENALPDPITQVQAAATPSIDAAIQDARIEAITMDSRPVAQAQPVQIATPTASVLGGQAAQPTEAILNQIQARIQPAMNKAILRLSPEALGRVAIEVTVDAGEVRAEMRVESADSLQAIQKYIPELKAMFAQADMELSELNLQLDSDGSGFDWEEETPDEKQAWFGSKANQNIESEAPGGANSPRLSSLEGGLDLIA
ncbi:MAG: flagellar hook-length control protein FliK, partial [Planctomycetota bacterium]|nr:flagellar hook-length control protein FliK [Planctomycetota bacterium]